MIKIANIITLVLALTFFLGCEDPCENISCLNDGICISGDCDCLLGFEGSTCETDSRDKFLGFYLYASGTCTNFAASLELIANSENNTV